MGLVPIRDIFLFHKIYILFDVVIKLRIARYSCL